MTSRLVPLLLCACVACSGAPSSRKDGAKEKPLVVTKGDVSERFLLTGELDAVSSEKLATPRTPQWNLTIRWLENDGALVKAGQKVVEFDNTAFATNLAEQKATATNAANDLVFQRAQNAIATADKTFELTKARVALEKARLEAGVQPDTLPRRVYQQKQLDLEHAQIALAKADDDLASHLKSAAFDLKVREIAIEKAQREIQAADAAIATLVLYAPRDGIFVVADHPWEGRKLESGDNVWVGLPVARLPDLTTMKVNALLSDVDDGRVVVGMRVTAVVDAYPDMQFPGSVTEVSPVAREPSQRSWRRSFLVTVALERTDPQRMLPGMSVRVEALGRALPGALLAPRVSVDIRAKPPRVRLADGTAVELEAPLCDPQTCAIRPLVPTASLHEGTLLGREGT